MFTGLPGSLPMTISGFVQVNEVVSVYQPPSVNGASSAKKSAAPQVVLLLSWGDALPSHIAKFTTLYRQIWPNAKIILVQTGVADFVWRSEATSLKLVEPVIKMLNEAEDDTLFVHVMSNAGSSRWGTINKSYLQQTQRSLSNAPTVIDSAPGTFGFQPTWAAIVASLPKAFIPRIPLGLVLGIVLILMQARKHLSPGTDFIEVARARLNDPAALVAGSRRCYIFSEQDDIIPWKDLVKHAQNAERGGWDVEMVKYAGSQHVGHYKQDPVKYRETIERTWVAGKL